MLTDHLRVNHDSDEEGRGLHSAFEHDPLQGYEMFVCTSGPAIPEVQHVRPGWYPDTLQPQGECDLSFHGLSFTRSVLIDVWVSLRTQSWLVNCWMRSSSTSLNWSPDRIVIIATIFSLYFQPYFSFFSSCHSWDHNQCIIHITRH